jgi:protein O-mannosyl-transferase
MARRRRDRRDDGRATRPPSPGLPETTAKEDGPTSSGPPPLAALTSRPGAVFAALAIVCLVAYLPALRGGFIWDDAAHVTRPELRSLAGLARIWFDVGATQQYYPLLHSAFWLQHWLWGDAVVGYHVVNGLLHALAAWLVYRVLRQLAIPGALLVAFVWALHPVMVESVAWISELKNTLSAVFYLSALLVYLRFDEGRRRADYGLASLLFLLGLASKTVTATLPAVLLVVLWWQRGRLRLRQDVGPLLPWVVLGAGAGAFTAWVERTLIGAQGESFALTLPQRLLIAGRALCFYVAKLAWPTDLIFIYPRWELDPRAAWQWSFLALSLMTLAIAAAVAWRWRSRAGRSFLAVALIFGLTLFPVLGFFNVFPFIFSFVADHFQYLASLAPITLVVGGSTAMVRRQSAGVQWAARAAAVVLLGGLMLLTWQQAGQYQDIERLYRTTIARNPSSWMAHLNLGTVLAEKHDYAGAIASYEAALRVRPNFADAQFDLGRVLVASGRPQEAFAHYDAVAGLQPDYPELARYRAEAHQAIARQMVTRGDLPDALAELRKALDLSPRHASILSDTGIVLLGMGQAADARVRFEQALAVRPDFPEALNNLARVLATDPAQCDPEAARRLIDRALVLTAPPPPAVMLQTRDLALAGGCRK